MTKMIVSLLATVLFVTTTYAQQPPQLCNQISVFTACVTGARQRVDACGTGLSSVPTVAFYECQCTELTSIQSCYSICPEDPQLQMQLPNEQANAKAWCTQSETMRAAENAKKNTTFFPSVTPKPSATTVPISSPPRPTVSTPGPVGVNGTGKSGEPSTTSSTKRPQSTSTINFSGGTTNGSSLSIWIVIFTLSLLIGEFL